MNDNSMYKEELNDINFLKQENEELKRENAILTARISKMWAESLKNDYISRHSGLFKCWNENINKND